MPADLSPIWISLATSLTATAITFVLGIAAAAWRERRSGPLFALLDGVFLLPLVLPPTVVGFLLLLLFGRNGPVGRIFLAMGTTVVFSWPATVIAAAVGSFPLMYVTARAAVAPSGPPVLLQAARTLAPAMASLPPRSRGPARRPRPPGEQDILLAPAPSANSGAPSMLTQETSPRPHRNNCPGNLFRSRKPATCARAPYDLVGNRRRHCLAPFALYFGPARNALHARELGRGSQMCGWKRKSKSASPTTISNASLRHRRRTGAPSSAPPAPARQ